MVVGNVERGRANETDMRVRDVGSVTRWVAATYMICFARKFKNPPVPSPD